VCPKSSLDIILPGLVIKFRNNQISMSHTKFLERILDLVLRHTRSLAFKNSQQSLPCNKRRQCIAVVSYNLLYSQYVAQIQISFFFVASGYVKAGTPSSIVSGRNSSKWQKTVTNRCDVNYIGNSSKSMHSYEHCRVQSLNQSDTL
jgi:hypothetical protein